MDLNKGHGQIQDKSLLRNSFSSQKVISISSYKVFKGMANKKLIVQKIIECRPNQELFFMNLLIERAKQAIQMKKKNCFKEDIQVETVQERKDDQPITYLLIFSPYFAHPANKMTDYCKYVSQDKKNTLLVQQKAQRIQQVLKILITKLMMSSNQQLYTYQCFLFQQNFSSISLNINKTSFVGMDFLLNNGKISEKDFREIYQLLYSDTLDDPTNKRLTLRLKFRTIGIILISLIQGKPFFIKVDGIQGTSQQILSFEKCMHILRDMRKGYTRILNSEMFKSLLGQLRQHLKIDIETFLLKIFEEEEKLTWNQVISMLVQKIPKRQDRSIKKTLKITKIIQKILTQTKYNGPFGINQLQNLGLSDAKLSTLAMLYGESTKIQDFLGCEDIDDYLMKPSPFNIKSLAIYTKLIWIVNFLEGDQRSKYIERLQEIRHSFRTSSQQHQQDDWKEEKEGGNVEKEKKEEEEAESTFESNHRQYMNEIIPVYGVLRQKVGSKRTLAIKGQNMAFLKYNKLFS